MVKAGVTAKNEDAVLSTIPAGSYRGVASGFQEIVYGVLTVNGSMDVDGVLVTDAMPT